MVLSGELGRLTRLERFARRFPIQIDFLGRALALTEDVAGSVWEIGLGGGRTLEYLETRTEKPITVFEIDDVVEFSPMRSGTTLVKSDLIADLPNIVRQHRNSVAFVHVDIGTTDYVDDLGRLAALGEQLGEVLNKGGVIVSDRPVAFSGLKLIASSHQAGWPCYMWQQQ